jgi:four helix bundle protein
MHNFKELKIWQLSRSLAKDAYVLTSEFLSEEKYGLISQLRRAAVSVSSNIAEGAGRGTDRDFAQFLNISLASQYELESLVLISSDLGLVSARKIEGLMTRVSEIQKMTYSLIKTLRSES